MLKEFIAKVRNYGIENVFKRFYSFYPAYIVSNKDPKNQGRLLLHIPAIHHTDAYEWVDAGMIFSGKDFGSQFIPRETSMVYVFFLQGDIRFPKWVNGWYGENEKPEQFKNRKVSGFVTPNGVSILIDDEKDTITISNKNKDYVKVTPDGLELLGNENYAVKYQELEKAFNELKNDFNNFANAYVPGGPATQGLPAKVLPSTADITPAKNEKIKTN